MGAVTGYTFTDVTADHTITATFAIDTSDHRDPGGQRRHRPGRHRRGGQLTGLTDQAFTITPMTATTWPTSWWTASPWVR